MSISLKKSYLAVMIILLMITSGASLSTLGLTFTRKPETTTQTVISTQMSTVTETSVKTQTVTSSSSTAVVTSESVTDGKQLERLDITSTYAATPTEGNYPVSVMVKNSGTLVLSIDRILIDNKAANATVAWRGSSIILDGTGASTRIININQGDSGIIRFSLPMATYKSGQAVEIVVHTISGGEYPKVIVLP